MAEFLLVLIAAVVVGAIGFGVSLLITGDDPGIEGHEPDGRAVPLPSSRPLVEGDVGQVRFDTTLRGYRMAQVDAALRRAGYDIGYKEELIQVLEAEVKALRDGRTEDADALRDAREAAVTGAGGNVVLSSPSGSSDSESESESAAEPAVVDLDKRATDDDSTAHTWGAPSPVVK
ncbi:DivIVA domain-containing protein [Dactylosporangium sp. NPDC050588]|uniref:DivIVA domain-containing protein n=1 Tax=Dactylosporangium sp. NPDC050588 TaxID=3157211 RepID=UPI0033F56839